MHLATVAAHNPPHSPAHQQVPTAQTASSKIDPDHQPSWGPGDPSIGLTEGANRQQHALVASESPPFFLAPPS